MHAFMYPFMYVGMDVRMYEYIYLYVRMYSLAEQSSPAGHPAEPKHFGRTEQQRAHYCPGWL